MDGGESNVSETAIALRHPAACSAARTVVVPLHKTKGRKEGDRTASLCDKGRPTSAMILETEQTS